jgi:hypothetical protein
MSTTNLIEDLRLLSPPSYAWLLWLAVALLGLGVAWWLWRRFGTRTAPPQTTPAPDVWEETLRELERLLPLLRPDQSRAYAIASTSLLRRYLERRFGIEAPRLATEEFLLAARQSPALPEPHRVRLGDYLRLCDLLKFGRAVAETPELLQLHEAAVEFVSTSKPAVMHYSQAPFPLTPALSPGEREARVQRVAQGDASASAKLRNPGLPLPAGEGWGEGERPSKSTGSTGPDSGPKVSS